MANKLKLGIPKGSLQDATIALFKRAGSSPAMAPIMRELTASPAHPHVITKPMAVPVILGKALPTIASVVGNTGAMETPAMNTSTKAAVGSERHRGNEQGHGPGDGVSDFQGFEDKGHHPADRPAA